ncbi:hypothetical protein K523DRAFT_100132 [Schizophyllum commune Tattone D]|nr:hypothetical protein K523DRAFT_100132 [Schizophyllum commune Tattone D]
MSPIPSHVFCVRRQSAALPDARVKSYISQAFVDCSKYGEFTAIPTLRPVISKRPRHMP